MKHGLRGLWHRLVHIFGMNRWEPAERKHQGLFGEGWTQHGFRCPSCGESRWP